MRARAVLAALIGGALVCGCGSAQPADRATSGGPAPLQRTVGHVLAGAVRPSLAARLHVPAGAVDVVGSEGALWVAGFGTVSRLDRASGRLEARIRTPATGDYSRIAVGAGSIWTTGAGGVVYRIDPTRDRVVATVHLGGSVQGIAVGAAQVWVTRPLDGAGEVIRVDPRTNRVAGPPIRVGPGPGQVTYGQGAVWVQNTSPASVMRIDPVTEHVSTVVGPSAVPYGSFVVGAIAIGCGSLWTVANDSLTRIDPKTNLVQASIRIPRGQGIAFGAGQVWVLASPRSSSPAVFDAIKHTAALWEVNPRSLRIMAKPIRLDALQPTAITATQGNVWVADYTSATIIRIRLVDDAHRRQRVPLGSGGRGSLAPGLRGL